MMSEKYCIEQAASCALGAAEALLANQRDSLLRSEAVWLGLAAREQALKSARAERERIKAEETCHD